MAEGGFDFQKFINDSKATIMSPKEYFAAMPKEGGFVEPLIKAVIYGLLAGIITFIWSLLHLTAAAGMMGGVFGGSVGVMAIVSSLIGAIIGLFVGGVIMLLISALCGGNTAYEANVRVVASLMVLSPIQALLGFTGGISIWLGGIIGLLVSLYGIYLMYNALVSALGAKEGTSKVVSIILAVIPVILLLSSLMCYRTASKMSEKYMKDSKEAEKAVQQMQQMLEEMKKKQK